MLVGYKPDGTSYRYTKGRQRGNKQTPSIHIPYCNVQRLVIRHSTGYEVYETIQGRTIDGLNSLLPWLEKRNLMLYDTVRMSEKGWLRAVVMTPDKILRPIVYGLKGSRWNYA